MLITFDHETNKLGMISMPVYGSVYDYVSNLPESSNNSTTSWSTKSEIVLMDIPSGSYKISWRYKWKMSAADRHFKWRLLRDTTTLTDTNTRYTNTAEFREQSGFIIVDFMGGSYQLKMQFQPGSGIAFISESYLEILRVN